MAQVTNFFVGANSGAGFRNLFSEMVDIEDTYDFMVLKGGPGVGKNTFMREVARAMDAGDRPLSGGGGGDGGVPLVLRGSGLPGRCGASGAPVRGGGWYVAPRQRIERTVLWDKHDLKSGVTAQIERGER